MAATTKIPTPICPGSDVVELGKFSFTIEYRGVRRAAILVRFQGVVYGYLNQCVHMPKTLDCEESNIFDETGRYLQCSMHNVCYDPISGLSMSEICAGKKLTSFKVKEEDGMVYLLDKRAKLQAEAANVN